MTVNSIFTNLQRLDELTPEATRHLFLETDPLRLEQALELVKTGDLKCINGIHRKVKEIFDPAQRGDRRILRMIRQLPDALSVDQLLKPQHLKLLQGYIHKKARPQIGSEELRLHILSRQTFCRIGANGSVTVQGSDNTRWPYNLIIKQLFIKALEGAYKLDGEAAAGNYKAQLKIKRDYKTHDYPVKKGLEMHHDYNFDEEDMPDEISNYLLLGVLSDRGGTLGWEGGDLIVQNDTTLTTDDIPFKMDRPFLTYEYPLNGAICLRNKKVMHQRTGVIAKQTCGHLARDLLVINLYVI